MKTLSGVVIGLLFITSVLFADVTYESETKLEFKGAMGSVMKLLGMSKPVHTIEYYTSNYKRSDTIEKDKVSQSQIIDLDKELFITVDHQKKKYTQMTFDEWRELMKSTMEQLNQSEEKGKEEESEKENVEWRFDLKVEKSGEKEKIAGKETEKVSMVMSVEAQVTETESETNKEAETSTGGMIVTADNWLWDNSSIQDEINNFNVKLVERLGINPGETGFEDILANIMKNNPQLGQAMQKVQEEGKKMQGLPLRTISVYKTTGNPEPEEKVKEEKDTEVPTSVGGLLGGLGKKIAKSAQKDEKKSEDANVLMSSRMEVIKVESQPIESPFFQVPDNYKLIEK